jgi:hypothetical protein
MQTWITCRKQHQLAEKKHHLSSGGILMISSHKVAEGLAPIDHLVLGDLSEGPRKDES